MIWSGVVRAPALSFWAALLLGAALGIIGVCFLKGTRPRTIGFAALAVALFIPIAARANPFETANPLGWQAPIVLLNGTLADATQVNADLMAATIVTASGDAGPFVTAGATKFCGTSAAATTGSFNFSGQTGYQAARAMCQDSAAIGSCRNPSGFQTAHMCTAEELVRSALLGVITATTPSGWYSTGVWAQSVGGIGNAITDCSGWTTSVNTNGAVWGSPNAGPTFQACSASNVVLCCN
jgi:hypothetical protein